MTLAAGILLGILVAWPGAAPETRRTATLMFMTALGVTLGSVWHTHIRGRPVGQNFLYAQVVFDVAIVTTIVHITTLGDEVVFAPLYILVITEGALLLPLPGGVLIGALASIVYFADLVWGHPDVPLSGTVSLQIGLFAGVALITGWLGDRVRLTGLALGAVKSELARLRLDTGDILGNISTGVLTIDGGGRLAYLNPAAGKILGLTLAQWEGAPVLGAVEAVAPGLATVLKRTLEERKPMSRFKTLARKGRGEITLGISTTMLEARDGTAPSVTAIFQDITDLERLELLNRRNERLEAVAELSASLAHEIKNPLASIRSAVEQLDKPSLQSDDRAVLQRLVLSESDRLSRLLSEFIEFSAMRIHASTSVDFNGVVRGAVTLVKQHPDAELGCNIECEGVDGPLLLPGDADLLHRLVFNLILNAVQFSGPDGNVLVSVEDCSEAGNLRGTEVPRPIRLSVQDSGPGVRPEDMGRIFDPFYTTRDGGSGLGLAVVHRAVKAHGGALFVEDAVGGGAHFLCYLPGAEAQVSSMEGAES